MQSWATSHRGEQRGSRCITSAYDENNIYCPGWELAFRAFGHNSHAIHTTLAARRHLFLDVKPFVSNDLRRLRQMASSTSDVLR